MARHGAFPGPIGTLAGEVPGKVPRAARRHHGPRREARRLRGAFPCRLSLRTRCGPCPSRPSKTRAAGRERGTSRPLDARPTRAPRGPPASPESTRSTTGASFPRGAATGSGARAPSRRTRRVNPTAPGANTSPPIGGLVLGAAPSRASPRTAANAVARSPLLWPARSLRGGQRLAEPAAARPGRRAALVPLGTVGRCDGCEKRRVIREHDMGAQLCEDCR